ncbi:MAG: helical backbone metal receptor, partial [Elusimicrobiota bacterium]|nr:helical backbone metal receptor [Elusimicrobiota bacterium]
MNKNYRVLALLFASIIFLICFALFHFAGGWKKQNLLNKEYRESAVLSKITPSRALSERKDIPSSNAPVFGDEKFNLSQNALSSSAGKAARKGGLSGVSGNNSNDKGGQAGAGYASGANTSAGAGVNFTLSANPGFLASIKRKSENNSYSLQSSLYSGIKSKSNGNKSRETGKSKENLNTADLTETSYDSLLREMEDLLTAKPSDNTVAGRLKKAIRNQLQKLRPHKPSDKNDNPQEDPVPDPGKTPPQFLTSMPRHLRPKTATPFTPEPPPALEEPQEEPEGIRIVSLIPSVTEIIFALGAGDNVIGVSNFCDYPSQVLALPQMGDSFTLNTGKILSLKPDVVFVYNGDNIKEDINLLRSENIQVVGWTDPTNLAQLAERIGSVAGAIGADASYLNSSIARGFARARANPKKRPRVYIDIWDFWPAADNSFIGFILNEAGGKNSFGKNDFVSSRDDIVKANPDVIIILGQEHKDYSKMPDKIKKKICRPSQYEKDIISRPGPRSPR